MTVSITYYGKDNQFWNAGPGGTGLAAKDVLVNTNSNSNTVNFNVSVAGMTFTGTVKGNFQFNGPISTMDKVSGTLTEVTSYLNGLIAEYTVIPQGTELQSWAFPSTTVAQYISTASTLNRGVTFVGSQGGQEFGDTLIGGTGKDSFTSYGGKITKPNQAAYFDGKDGIDLAILQGKLADYKVQTSTFTDQTDMSYKAKVSGWQLTDSVASRNGVTQLTNVERVKFSDISVALDIGSTQNAGSVYMLYKAAFNRPSDAGGMGYWISLKDGGADIVTSIAQGFVNSAEFIGKYGANPTNASYVSNLYQNVLGRAGEAGGVAYWTGEMDAGRVSKAQALVQFATLPEGAGIVAPLIANGIQYQEFLG